MSSTIETERFTLTGWRDDDLTPYAVMVSERDPRAAAAPVGGVVDERQLRAHVARRRTELAETGIALLALRVDGVFAGYCGLTVGHASLDEPELAYELLREWHGCGYATEAARAVVADAGRTGRRWLWASVREWNAPSFRVLEKVGFAATGRETANDWGRSIWWGCGLS